MIMTFYEQLYLNILQYADFKYITGIQIGYMYALQMCVDIYIGYIYFG